MPSLTVQIPGAEAQTYEFEEPHVTLGRSQENSIIIDHDSLSTSHAQLVRNADGKYTLMDLGSTNGTYVDGEQIAEVVLPDMASLAFGQVTAHWQTAQGTGGVEAAAAPALHTNEFTPSGRPANFKSISPHPKRKKKDPSSGVALGLGFLALFSAVILAGAVMMLLK